MKKNNTINDRIFKLLVLFAVVVIFIFRKLIVLQVVNHKDYTIRAIEQINKAETINSARGRILDTKGRDLAINESAASVVVNPKELENKELTIEALSSEIGISKRALASMLNTDKQVKVAQWVPRDIAQNIRQMGLAGVQVTDGVKRYYPMGPMASHVVGFTNIDNVGQYGAESTYNKELSGVPGRVYKSSDKDNNQIPTGDRETFMAIDGQSLVLTLDEQIQRIAYEESIKIIEEFNAEKVQVIVQETKTGDILAMSSYPSFDNNEPREPIDSKQEREWSLKESVEEGWYENWINPMVSHSYEPGSTFKLITAALAIEQNTSNPNEQYYCTGYIRDIKNAPVLRCVSYLDPHGDITLKQGLALSCNPTFVYANRELGKENFYNGIKRFGFGEKTGIDLPGESHGIIPASPEDITELDLATMSYGHGIASTPIQLINAVSAIGNDGVLMKPRVVKEMRSVDGSSVTVNPVTHKREVLSKTTAKTMQEMMVYAVEEGIASKAKSNSYTIGGKTGTANKSSKTGGYIEGEYISSFIGMAPMEDPKITVLVIVDSPKEETYGSLVAAPHGKNIIEKSLDYLGVETTIKGGEEMVEVPDIRYNVLGDGGAKLTELGLKYTTDYTELNEGTVVSKQRPRAGTKVKVGSIVELTVDSNTKDTITVPDLTGKKISDVVNIIEILGLDLSTTGRGVVINQEPSPGKKIKVGEDIAVELSPITEEDDSKKDEFRDDMPNDIGEIEEIINNNDDQEG